MVIILKKMLIIFWLVWNKNYIVLLFYSMSEIPCMQFVFIFKQKTENFQSCSLNLYYASKTAFFITVSTHTIWQLEYGNLKRWAKGNNNHTNSLFFWNVINVLEKCGGFWQKFGYIWDIKTWLNYLENMLHHCLRH